LLRRFVVARGKIPQNYQPRPRRHIFPSVIILANGYFLSASVTSFQVTVANFVVSLNCWCLRRFACPYFSELIGDEGGQRRFTSRAIAAAREYFRFVAMDGLSGAASVMAAVSLTIQLVGTVNTLRKFWLGIKGAPAEVQDIVDDLALLNGILSGVDRAYLLITNFKIALVY
jgi:hypothetical protein